MSDKVFGSKSNDPQPRMAGNVYKGEEFAVSPFSDTKPNVRKVESIKHVKANG